MSPKKQTNKNIQPFLKEITKPKYDQTFEKEQIQKIQEKEQKQKSLMTEQMKRLSNGN